jgi:SAM-dependent methyltransferase
MKRSQDGNLMNNRDLLCPICQDPGSKSAVARVTLGPEDQFDLRYCAACGTRFFHPLPTDRQLSAFYAAEYYTFDRENEEGKGRCFAHWLSRLQPAGRFLDVGCATGFMLNGVHQKSAWEVYGCELSPEASAFARDQLGLRVSTGQLVAAAYPYSYFDVIQVNNVLEHVLDPVGLLREIHRILKPQGRLLLNIPNGANDVLPLEAFWRAEHLPAHSKDGHLFFIPAAALRNLFKQTGFFIQRQKTYGLKRGLRNLGWLPPKRDWKTAYSPRRSRNTSAGILPLPGQHPKPAWYHAFRYYTGHWKAIPGLHAFGLDFSFLLRSVKRE